MTILFWLFFLHSSVVVVVVRLLLLATSNGCALSLCMSGIILKVKLHYEVKILVVMSSGKRRGPKKHEKPNIKLLIFNKFISSLSLEYDVML